MAAQNSSWMLMLLALACLLFAHDKMILVQVHASNSDPLQDFCVADLSATAPSVNGFPCKLPKTSYSLAFEPADQVAMVCMDEL
jgi:hypothetical protein